MAAVVEIIKSIYFNCLRQLADLSNVSCQLFTNNPATFWPASDAAVF